LYAALHLRFASLEVRRGDTALASRHLAACEVSLKEAPNSYLSAQRLSAASLTDWLRDRVPEAIHEARAAVKLSIQDGHGFVHMSALSNLAQFALLAGDLPDAQRLLDQAWPLVRGSHIARCVGDTRAQLLLAQGDIESAESCLREISPEGWESGGRLEASWPDIEVNLTRIELLRRKGELSRAADLALRAAQLARTRHEWFVEPLLTIRHSEVLAEAGRTAEAERVLGELIGRDSPVALHVLAEIEKTKGRLNELAGRSDAGRRCFARGLRLARGLGRPESPTDQAFPTESRSHRRTKGGGWSAVEALAVCGRLAGRAEMHGEELLEVFLDSGAVRRVRFISTRGGPSRLVRRIGKKKSNVRAVPPIILELGKVDGVSFELHVEPRQDIRSRSIVAAICRLVKDSLVLAQLQEEAKYRESLWPVEEGLMLEGNVFVAPRMREIQTTARRVAPSELPVLITGETGAGKEVIAREVHDASPRAAKNFGVLVCSAVPREMLDSHLFGHRRGAFTGAIDNFLGVIRANEGGTLFLDEIGEVSLDLQVKLLRFLETGEVHPLGETKPVKVDVRVIAATNQPLETLMKEGRFREDLFYRLNVVRLTIPPLRERREEILPFVERFLMRECARAGRPVPDLSDEAIEHLLLYTWPGNVRQLLNEVKRILATLPVGGEVTPAVLSSDITAERQAAIAKAVAASPNQMLLRTDQPLQAAIDEVERALLKHALATSPDQETAAAKLDITRKGLFLKRQRLGLE
jgi:DNA-binding NtrC family response regulator